MKIKLKKNWRHSGQVIMAGTVIEIKNEKTISYLKDNGFIKEEKKEKKAKKVAEENN
tara:strand:+ start:1702 stop:1872 length:171 start_codon:yes stop_codon:yes gene_type:complete